MEELPETERPRHLLFSAGYEGGSIELYTHNLEQLAPVWRESNEMSFDEDDDEIWVSRSIEYADFVTYWRLFRQKRYWFRCVPLHIHPAVCEQISYSIDQIVNSTTSPTADYPHGFRRWQQAVVSARSHNVPDG